MYMMCIRGEQLDALAQQIGRLAQELDATKLELAEALEMDCFRDVFMVFHGVSSSFHALLVVFKVVIEKEEDEGELKREVELLRKTLESQKALQHTQEPRCLDFHPFFMAFAIFLCFSKYFSWILDETTREESQMAVFENKFLEALEETPLFPRRFQASEQHASLKQSLEGRIQGCEERLVQSEAQQSLLKERMEDCALALAWKQHFLHT